MQNVVEFGSRGTSFRGRKFHCERPDLFLASVPLFPFSILFFSPPNCFNWIGFEAHVRANPLYMYVRKAYGGALNECGAWVS